MSLSTYNFMQEMSEILRLSYHVKRSKFLYFIYVY